MVAKHLEGTRWAGGGVQLLFWGGSFRTEATRDPPLSPLPLENSVLLRASQGTGNLRLREAFYVPELVSLTLQAIAIGAGAGGRRRRLRSHNWRKSTLLFHR